MTQRIDDHARRELCAKVELHELIGRAVALKRVGAEYEACCPFHDERTPSFTVAPAKGFYHCFGCGAHGDALSWLIDHERLEYVEACKVLDERAFERLAPAKAVPPKDLPRRLPTEGRWLPLTPVPDAAPELLGPDGRTVEIWNPKPNERHPDGRFVRYRPTRADAYRDHRGRLLGYVLRLEFEEAGKRIKITPTITWCVGPDGAQRWCVQHFRPLRPLYGLDALADDRRIAIVRTGEGERSRLVRGTEPALADGEALVELRPIPVLIVEGEKCRAAGAGALPHYAVVSWPGGSKGTGYVDWSPLSGRDIVLWPDADKAGRDAMQGWVDGCGVLHRGVAQHAHRAGARSLRLVDSADQPPGWDIADALDPEKDAWTPRQLAAWAASRVCEVVVESEAGRAAR